MKTRVEIVGGTFCSRVAFVKRTFAVLGGSSVSSVGRWSIRSQVSRSAALAAGCANFIKCLAGSTCLARATRGLPELEMPHFQHSKSECIFEMLYVK